MGALKKMASRCPAIHTVLAVCFLSNNTHTKHKIYLTVSLILYIIIIIIIIIMTSCSMSNNTHVHNIDRTMFLKLRTESQQMTSYFLSNNTHTKLTSLCLSDSIRNHSNDLMPSFK